VADRLRRRGVGAGRAGHPVRLAAAAADPATGLGVRYVAAYAVRQGGPAGLPLSPDLAGQAVTELAADPGYREHACVLTAEGLRPLT
jgi:hypothetical protein